MVGTLSIKINSANPNIPLKTLFAFINSPSSIRVIDAPKKIGKWTITEVFITANYPDNRIVTSQCVLTGGCWNGTIVGSTVTGKSLNGYTVTANGIDENGSPIDGYVLGKGSIEILDADTTLAPTDPIYYIHVLSAKPDNPNKGDAYVDGGVWYFFNGESWVTLGGTFAGNGWAQYPESEGGDGKWHRLVISDGKISYEEDGVDEPVSEPFALKSDLDAEVDRSTQAEDALQDQIDSITIELEGVATKSELSAETEARKAADTVLQNQITTISSDYLKSADKTELEGKITAEENRAKGVENSLSAAINTKANDNAVVKLTGNQVVSGHKSFMTAMDAVSVGRNTANSYLYLHGGTSVADGSTITLAGMGYTGTALPVGGLQIAARDGKSKETEGETQDSYCNLVISPQGNIKMIGGGPDYNPQIYGVQFAMAGMPSESFVDIVVPETGGYVAMPSKIGWLSVYGKFTDEGFLSVSRTLGTHNNYGYIQRGKAGETFRFVIPVGRWANMNFSFIYSNASFTRVRFYSSMAEVAQ